MAKLNFTVGADTSEIQRKIKEVKQGLQSTANVAETSGEAINQAFRKAGTAVATFFTLNAAKDFATQMARVRGEYQQMEIAFNTMLGSKQKADNLMNQLKETALSTPFEMMEIVGASKQLIAYGFQAEQINETLVRLGDISAGLSIPLGELAYLYGTTMVQGRLYTRDLLQFTTRGIPLIGELAKQFGVAESKVQDLVTQGKVGFPEVQKAIEALTNKGKFGGLMAEQSKSISGIISNIHDEIANMFNEMGKQNEAIITNTLNGAKWMVQHWQGIAKAVAIAVVAIGAYKTALIVTAVTQKLVATAQNITAWLQLTKSITSAKDAMLLFNMATKANTLGIIISVVATAITSFALLRKKTDDTTDAQKRLQEATANFNGTLAKEYSKLDTYFDKLKNAKQGTNEYKLAKDAILNQYGQYLKGLNLEKDGVLNVAKAYEAVKESIKRATMEKIKSGLIEEAGDELASNIKGAQTTLDKALKELPKTEQDFIIAQFSKITAGVQRTIEEQNKLQAIIDKGKEPEPKNYGILSGLYQAYTPDSSSTPYNVTIAYKNVALAIAEARNAQKGFKQELSKVDQLTKSWVTPNEAKAITPTSNGTELTDNDKNKQAKEAEQLKQEYLERQKNLGRYRTAEIEDDQKFELYKRQRIIDLQKESFEKQQQQIQLNYDKLKAENEARKKKMINDLKEVKTIQWQQQNPKATKSQTEEYKQTLTLTVNDLSNEQKEMLNQYSDLAKQYKIKANKNALEYMLNDFLSYNQQRTKAEEEYNAKIKALYTEEGKLRKGVTLENIEEIERKRDEATKSIDEQFAQREDTFRAWQEQIADLTIEKLEEELTKAKKLLEDTKLNNSANPQTLATARAMVNSLTTQIEHLNNRQSKGVNRSIEDWKNLAEQLTNAGQSFDKLGDKIGGTIGRILSTVGTLATSTVAIINNITQLASTAVKGIDKTAQGAGKAVSTVEKASVILSIIATAVELMQKLEALVSNDNHLSELQNQSDQQLQKLQQLNTEAGKVNEALSQAGINALYLNGAISNIQTGNYTIASQSIKLQAEALNQASKHFTITSEQLATAINNVKYTANKALGEGYFSEVKAQTDNYVKQIELIKQKRDLELQKKKPNKEAIQAYEQEIIKTQAEAVENLNKKVEDLLGGSAKNLANNLANAFFKAFEAGENAAKAWGKEVDNIVSNIVKRLLTNKFIEEPLGEIINKYKQKLFPSGSYIGTDKALEIIKDMTNDLNQAGEDFQKVMDALPEDVRKKLQLDEFEAPRKGIATASQDSIDELNGRITAVQGHTYIIAEQTQQLTNTASSLLTSVQTIERSTTEISQTLNNVSRDIKSVKNQTETINTKGVKIR